MEKIPVLIVNEHKLVREGLKKLLSEDSRFEVLGEASTLLEALEMTKPGGARVVLLDVGFRVQSAAWECREFKERCPQTGLVILMETSRESDYAHLLEVGAEGYLLKNSSPSQLKEALIRASRGEMFFSPGLAEKIVKVCRRASRLTGKTSLTPREKEVLRLVARGLSNREIVSHLYLSEKTVKNHLTTIFRKNRSGFPHPGSLMGPGKPPGRMIGSG